MILYYRFFLRNIKGKEGNGQELSLFYTVFFIMCWESTHTWYSLGAVTIDLPGCLFLRAMMPHRGGPPEGPSGAKHAGISQGDNGKN